MNALSQAVYNVLSADVTLTGLLASYTPPGSTAVPAIFSADPAPDGAPMPFIVWGGALHDEPFGGKLEETTGRAIFMDLRVYAVATGSAQLIDSICERIRALLHNVTLTVAGFTNVIARCTAGPLNAPTDPRIMGRVLTFQWTLD
jgi:hypothetical protein